MGGVVWTQLSDRAIDGEVDDLRADLEAAYEDTDADDIPPLFPHEETDLFQRAGHDPTTIGKIDGGWRANYRVSALSEARCVWVDWTEPGVEAHDARGCP